jgi:amino acid transporter
VPTYLFVVSIVGLIGYGALGAIFDWIPEAPYQEHAPGLEGISLFLLLRAFASGCAALTGVEAGSNGVPAFKPPEAHNARTVMTWLGAILIVLFLGITYLAHDSGIRPMEHETVVSQLARHVFGSGALYYEVQAVTMLILLLAANTSYADFPRLASLLAKDRFVARQFTNQGDRGVFSNGIIILSGLPVTLLVVFGGDTNALIFLYAVGVFVSFTLSQSGMVVHWLRRRLPGWRWRAWVNGIGAATTALVMVTIAATKFVHGAWLVVIVIPALVAIFLAVHSHYDDVARQLSLNGTAPPDETPIANTVLVLVGDLHRGVLAALKYTRSISPSPKAVYVEVDTVRTRRLEAKWGAWGLGTLDYVDSLLVTGSSNHYVTIILPEFVPARWWQHLLHNQTALLIKGAMLFRKRVIVADVPYHLR